jgi:hypothetical protein
MLELSYRNSTCLTACRDLPVDLARTTLFRLPTRADHRYEGTTHGRYRHGGCGSHACSLPRPTIMARGSQEVVASGNSVSAHQTA